MTLEVNEVLLSLCSDLDRPSESESVSPSVGLLPRASLGYHPLFFCGSFLISDFPGGSDGKVSVYNAGDPGLSPGLGRSPGEGNGNPLQHSCLENPMEGGA